MNLERIKNTRGFTLAELMVVVVIVGVLSSMAIVRYRGVREKVLKSQAKLWLGRIASAIQTMGYETGEWPGHQPAGYVWTVGENEVWDLTAPKAGLLQNDPQKPYAGWNGPYIEVIPKDPWGRDYFLDTDYQIKTPAGTKWAAVVGSFGPTTGNGGKNKYGSDEIYLILSTDDAPWYYYR